MAALFGEGELRYVAVSAANSLSHVRCIACNTDVANSSVMYHFTKSVKHAALHLKVKTWLCYKDGNYSKAHEESSGRFHRAWEAMRVESYKSLQEHEEEDRDEEMKEKVEDMDEDEAKEDEKEKYEEDEPQSPYDPSTALALRASAKCRAAPALPPASASPATILLPPTAERCGQPAGRKCRIAGGCKAHRQFWNMSLPDAMIVGVAPDGGRRGSGVMNDRLKVKTTAENKKDKKDQNDKTYNKEKNEKNYKKGKKGNEKEDVDKDDATCAAGGDPGSEASKLHQLAKEVNVRKLSEDQAMWILSQNFRFTGSFAAAAPISVFRTWVNDAIDENIIAEGVIDPEGMRSVVRRSNELVRARSAAAGRRGGCHGNDG